MSLATKPRALLGGAVADRLGGEQPGPLRAAAGAAVAGGVTGIVVFRLLRKGTDRD